MKAESELLAGKVVIVAGVGPGLGSATALRCAANGADVAIAARRSEVLDALAERIRSLGRRALPVPTDLTRDADCAKLVSRCAEELGRVDGLVSNAFAMPPFQRLTEQPLDVIREGFEINLFASLRLAREVEPVMRAQGGGSLVFTNSSVLRQNRESFGAYKMAKHALLAMARNLAAELGPHGIRVNSVAPGFIGATAADLLAKVEAAWSGEDEAVLRQRTTDAHMLRRVPEPDEIAGTLVFLLSDLAYVVTGQCIDVNAGEFTH